MKFSHPLPRAIFGAAMVGSAIVQLATPVALAAVIDIAKEITVRIDGPGAGGSGFIVKREGNIYTVATNWHVVDRQGQYIVKTDDGRQHRVRGGDIKELPGADLAVIYFTSDQNYRVAELADSNDVRESDTVYVSGWRNPWSRNITEPVYSLIQGQITGRQRPNDDGYALIYNADGNYIGMSGGPLLTENGQVIGVNGLLDEEDSLRGQRVASLAIPINTFERLQARVSPPVNIERAEAFFKQGFEHLIEEKDYESAIEDFNQAIRLNPKYSRAYNGRGLAYSGQGDYGRAIADYNESLRLNNSEPWLVYRNRGNVYLDQEDYGRAIADYNEAIRLNPNYAHAYNSRGLAYSRQGDEGRAIADYNEAIRLNPDLAIPYNNRGWTYYLQGDYQKAIADCNEAIRLNPDLAIPYETRGNAYAGQGDYGRAIADFNEAIRLDTEFAFAYFSRGIIYQKQGNNRQALADFRKAADLYQQQGKQEDYQDALERIRELE